MKVLISPKRHHAVIFDLDGVLTQTAQVHAKAWKKLFDPFLKRQSEEKGIAFVPFDFKKDYLQYVDGKPRYEGIQSFLTSRDIHLPMGDPEDSPDKVTITGMGNKKNQLFLKQLEQDGVNVYQSTIDLIKQLREHAVKIGLISSSKNCTSIINKIGVTELFDVKVDGMDAAKMEIKGKPEPDIFLKASDQLGVEPRHVVVVEDAISGVQAGKRGGFGLVIGVDRSDQSEELRKKGADVVVKDLSEVSIDDGFSQPLDAIEHFEQLKALCSHKKVAVFLDYDGTLTPIVSRPELAKLGDQMKQTLQRLVDCCKVAIISGRDRLDVQKRVQLEGVFYAGSHGFDISGPGGQRFEIDAGKEKLPQLDAAEKELNKTISEVSGAWIERKKYSVAIHYRQVAPENEKKVEDLVKRVHSGFAGDLRLNKGKKIFELQPAIQWHKGKALNWLIQLLDLDRDDVIPIYIGDDTTDEDAFKELLTLGHGIGIAVQETKIPTAAQFVLQDTDQVQTLLELFISEGVYKAS